jgi:hypothetical protein
MPSCVSRFNLSRNVGEGGAQLGGHISHGRQTHASMCGAASTPPADGTLPVSKEVRASLPVREHLAEPLRDDSPVISAVILT